MGEEDEREEYPGIRTHLVADNFRRGALGTFVFEGQNHEPVYVAVERCSREVGIGYVGARVPGSQ